MQYKKLRIPAIILFLLMIQFVVLLNAVPIKMNTNSITSNIHTTGQTSMISSYSLIQEEKSSAYFYSVGTVPFFSKKIGEIFLKKSLPVILVDYTLPIVGYALRAESEVPIEYDDFGLCRIHSNNINNEKATITLIVKSGTYTFSQIPISGEFHIDEIGNLVCKYELERPHSGFFMKIITDPEITYIELACDSNVSQLCYQNLLQSQEYDLEPFYVKNSQVNFYTQIFPANRFEEQSFSEMRTTLIRNLKNGIKVYQSPQWKEQNKSLDTRSITTTDYVISFEAQGTQDPDLTFAQDMVESDHYVVALTEIDIGIYRDGPTESEVKSDLAYYNKDQITEGTTGYRRNIKAYAPYAHEHEYYPGTSYFIRDYWDWWKFPSPNIYEYLWYDEVEAIWYHQDNPSYEIDVHPNDMIILATVCYGYSYGSSGTPYMPKAFGDHGALSYVGATLPLGSNDETCDAFWSRLCIFDESVYAATLHYIDIINLYANPDLIYDHDIKIYGGKSNAYLNN